MHTLPNLYRNVRVHVYLFFKVLSDADKRKIYDQHGEEGLSKGDVGGDPFSR